MKLNFNPKGLEIDCLEGESVYEAASRQGVRLPISCKNGVCEICKARLIDGRVREKTSLVEAVTQEEEVLLCKTFPETHCTFEIENIYGPGELPVKKLSCQIEDVSILKGHVYRVSLLMPAGKLQEFFAGQYLALHLPGKEEPHFFSIASRPGIRELELHIQADPHLEKALEVVQYLQKNTLISVSLPYGKSCLSEIPGRPLILIAAGTGFAQMKSIIEHLLANECDKPIALYWGVRQESELYHKALAEQWLAQYSHISFTPLISDIEDNQSVEHHHKLAKAVMADHSDYGESLVFVSGSPRLVYTIMDDLVEAGLPESQFFSDVLEYAPRDV